jgi:hypothetical protein
MFTKVQNLAFKNNIFWNFIVFFNWKNLNTTVITFWVHSHAPSIRSHRGTKVVWPDFQPMRVPEEPVCIDIFRQNPVFTSLHLKSPVHVHRLCIIIQQEETWLSYMTKNRGAKDRAPDLPESFFRSTTILRHFCETWASTWRQYVKNWRQLRRNQVQFSTEICLWKGRYRKFLSLFLKGLVACCHSFIYYTLIEHTCA